MEEEMKKKIKAQLKLRVSLIFCKHSDTKACKECFSKLTGDVSGLMGNVSGLRGNVSGLRGDVSGLRGDVSEIIEVLRENGSGEIE